MSSNTSWRIDDMDGGLDGGLASELLNLSGLGNEYGADGAYNMRFEQNVCQLMIKRDPCFLRTPKGTVEPWKCKFLDHFLQTSSAKFY